VRPPFRSPWVPNMRSTSFSAASFLVLFYLTRPIVRWRSPDASDTFHNCIELMPKGCKVMKSFPPSLPTSSSVSPSPHRKNALFWVLSSSRFASPLFSISKGASFTLYSGSPLCGGGVLHGPPVFFFFFPFSLSVRFSVRINFAFFGRYLSPVQSPSRAVLFPPPLSDPKRTSLELRPFLSLPPPTSAASH